MQKQSLVGGGSGKITFEVVYSRYRYIVGQFQVLRFESAASGQIYNRYSPEDWQTLTMQPGVAPANTDWEGF